MKSLRGLKLEELVDRQAGLFEDGVEGAFGKVSAGMVRHNRASMRLRVVPDFVAAFGVSVEHEA